jgi:hypothetical protein
MYKVTVVHYKRFWSTGWTQWCKFVVHFYFK